MNRRPFVWIAALALSAVAAGHSVAYYLAVPTDGQRTALLAQTGHSYWKVALTVAVLLELAGVLALAVRHFRAGRAGTPSLHLTFGQLAGRLAAIQVAAFTALEVTERLRSGIPVGEMFHRHLFLLGVAIQVLVAFAGALLLRWLATAAEAIGSMFAPRPVKRRTTVALPAAKPLDIPGYSPLCDGLRGRAPPVLLVSPH